MRLLFVVLIAVAWFISTTKYILTDPGGANDLLQTDVHPVVTIYKMAIVCLSILQLNKLKK